MAAEDSRKRSTVALASWAAALAWSASLPASRTWEPMPSAEWVNLSAACEKTVAVELRGAGAPGQGLGALANGGKRRRGRLGAAGDRTRRALELADHRAEFELEQFEDFPRRNCRRKRPAHRPQRIGVTGVGRDGRRSRFLRTLSKQTERHGPLWEHENEGGILAFGHEVMVNDCLIRGQRELPLYRKCLQIFDFAEIAAYNAALSTPTHSGRILEERRMAGHSQFKNIMHRKGRQDAQKSKAVRQAGAGNHGRGQDGPARSRR